MNFSSQNLKPIFKKNELGPRVINVFLCLMQIGSMAVYALFIAQNLQPIFEHYGGEVFENLGNRVYIAMVLPFMIALCSIRNLRYLSPFSILANIIQGGPTGYCTSILLKSESKLSNSIQNISTFGIKCIRYSTILDLDQPVHMKELRLYYTS